MNAREVGKFVAKYFTTAIMVVAFIIFEAEGIDYSDLFVAVLTACLGTSGIMVYGDVRK